MSEQVTTQESVGTEFEGLIARSWPDQVYPDELGVLRERLAESRYFLGNKDLPVARLREYIVDTVKDNLLTIITAATGTGKSSNIPPYLFESGAFDRVVVTQPRIVAARELKRYVDDEIATWLHDSEHDLVGYATAPESDSSDNNAILYVTDGLQLMHEIARNGITKDQVLVLDEFHERSRNMDALLAIAVKYGIRTVVMSATLDATGLSDHYSDILGVPVPVIDIPGVTYEVEERESDDLDSEVIAAARDGKNILVFLPGRKEINSAMARLERRVPSGYTLLTLNGDQTPDEQSKVFSSYAGGKIIFSTAVGQTSITIDDIDVVIDCGYERTSILDEEGDESLAIQPSSRATCDQRRGRVGRTKSGLYVRAQLRGYPPLPSLDDATAYDIPAIQRSRTDDLQLKLASFGHSIDSLPFFDRPSDVEIARGGERLTKLELFKRLGKTALDGYAITPTGEKAAQLPLDVNSARMVLEARKHGPAVELQMMAAAAVQQVDGITSTVKGMSRWRKLSAEKNSDIIAGIDYFVAAMQRNADQRQKSDIVGLRFTKAFRSFEQLARKRNLDINDLTVPTDEQRDQLLRSIVAGTDELFILSGRMKSGRASYLDNSKKRGKRHLLSSTSIEEDPHIVTGSRFNLQQVRSKRVGTTALISSASGVTMEMLTEVVPDRATTVIDSFKIDSSGVAHTDEVVYFDGHNTRQHISREAQASDALHRFIVEQIFTENKIDVMLPKNIAKAREIINGYLQLQHRTPENLGIPEALQEIMAKTRHEATHESRSFADIDPFIDLSEIAGILPQYIQDEIQEKYPDNISITLNNGQLIFAPVEYLPDNDRACVTIAAQYFYLVPFAIADRRVSVRSTKRNPYVQLEIARDNYERPTRREIRAMSRKGSLLAQQAKKEILNELPSDQQSAKPASDIKVLAPSNAQFFRHGRLARH
jgi:HrpA-like RNA helicase